MTGHIIQPTHSIAQEFLSLEPSLSSSPAGLSLHFSLSLFSSLLHSSTLSPALVPFLAQTKTAVFCFGRPSRTLSPSVKSLYAPSLLFIYPGAQSPFVKYLLGKDEKLLNGSRSPFMLFKKHLILSPPFPL